MTTIKPVGAMLIVFKRPKNEIETDGGMIVGESLFVKAEIMAVSEEWADRYKVGELVHISENTGNSVHYQKKPCLYINGKPFTDGGDVVSIVIE